jgi:hypothetical protein
MCVLSFSAMLVGGVAGSWAYTFWADRALGVASFPFLFFGAALAPFFSVIYLFDRYVTVYCPRCAGVMTKKGVGKSFFFTCTSCGHSQYG